MVLFSPVSNGAKVSGTLRIPRLVKPVVAVMSADRELIPLATGRMSEILGEVDVESPAYVFDFTDYYHAEMGAPLFKQFFSFRQLQKPEFLPHLKRKTAACERMNRTPGGGRPVNLDPGYWSDAKLVLASTKNYSHRICIGRRIFAEIILRYHKGKLQPMEWTYPDYRTTLALEFFEKVRKSYLQQIARFGI